MNDCIVVIPTYNEIGNVEAIIRKVFDLKHPFDLLIIDDGFRTAPQQLSRN